MRAMRLAVAAAAAGGLAGGWMVLRRRDERAIAADPEYAELAEPRDGIPVEVESDDGTRLHAEVFGPHDAPTVVLVHGWSCSLRFWRYQLRDLRADYRLVAYDLRGHGRSTVPTTGDYSTDALAADLDAVLRTCVPAGEQVVVVGHSMGGMSLVAWAGAHPDQVRHRLVGAVLVDTGMRRLAADARLAGLVLVPAPIRMALARVVLGMPLPLPARPDPLLNRATRYIALGGAATPGQVAFCTQMILDCPPKVRAAFGLTLSTLDLAEALRHLSVPAVVVVGGRDRLTPPEQARALADRLPGSTLVELPDRGHMTPVEAHEAITANVRAVATRTLGGRR